MKSGGRGGRSVSRPAGERQLASSGVRVSTERRYRWNGTHESPRKLDLGSSLSSLALLLLARSVVPAQGADRSPARDLGRLPLPPLVDPPLHLVPVRVPPPPRHLARVDIHDARRRAAPVLVPGQHLAAPGPLEPLGPAEEWQVRGLERVRPEAVLPHVVALPAALARVEAQRARARRGACGGG